MPAPAVTVATAAQEAVPINVDAIGNAQPYRTVQLKSMVDGQINRVLFRQGDYVHAGQLLFELDKRPFQAALDQARGKLSQDKATASGRGGGRNPNAAKRILAPRSRCRSNADSYGQIILGRTRIGGAGVKRAPCWRCAKIGPSLTTAM